VLGKFGFVEASWQLRCIRSVGRIRVHLLIISFSV
jgi:hypothetical protein